MTPARTPQPRRCPLPPPPPPPCDLRLTLTAIVVVLIPHLAGAAVMVAATQSLRIPTSPPYACHHLLVVECPLSVLVRSFFFLVWWLLSTSLFLLSSLLQREMKHIIAYLDGNIPPFCLSRHHASGQERDNLARPHYSSESLFERECTAHTTHQEIDWGKVYCPMPMLTTPHFPPVPAFATPAAVDRLVPCLTHWAYRQKEGAERCVR